MGDAAKKAELIKEVLKDQKKFDAYLKTLHFFFKGDITLEEMTHKIVKLLTWENIKLHNDFIHAIQIKIDIGAHSSQYLSGGYQSLSHKDKAKEGVTKLKVISRNKSSSHHQIEVNSEVMATSVPRVIPELDYKFSTCSLLGAFPDVQCMYGILYVCAISHDLEMVPEICAIYVSAAVKELIRNILTTVVSRRHTSSLHTYFPHAVSATHTTTLSKTLNTLPFSNDGMNATSFSRGKLVPQKRLKTEWGKSKAINELALDNPLQKFSPLSIWELYNALMTKKDTLPFASIRTRILEYCIVKLQESNCKKFSL